MDRQRIVLVPSEDLTPVGGERRQGRLAAVFKDSLIIPGTDGSRTFRIIGMGQHPARRRGR